MAAVFVILLLLIGATIFLRLKKYLRLRPALVIIAILVLALVATGFTIYKSGA